MNDSDIEQAIAAIKQSGVQVREDPQLYMHAKIIVVDNSFRRFGEYFSAIA